MNPVSVSPKQTTNERNHENSDDTESSDLLSFIKTSMNFITAGACDTKTYYVIAARMHWVVITQQVVTVLATLQ